MKEVWIPTDILLQVASLPAWFQKEAVGLAAKIERKANTSSAWCNTTYRREIGDKTIVLHVRDLPNPDQLEFDFSERSRI